MARMLIIVIILTTLAGCKTVEVVFVAKYQDGPVSLEMHSK